MRYTGGSIPNFISETARRNIMTIDWAYLRKG